MYVRLYIRTGSSCTPCVHGLARDMVGGIAVGQGQPVPSTVFLSVSSGHSEGGQISVVSFKVLSFASSLGTDHFPVILPLLRTCLKIYPYTVVEGPLGLQDVETLKISKHLAHESEKVVNPHPPEIFLILICIRG